MRHPYSITMCLTQMNLAAGQFLVLAKEKKKKKKKKKKKPRGVYILLKKLMEINM